MIASMDQFFQHKIVHLFAEAEGLAAVAIVLQAVVLVVELQDVPVKLRRDGFDSSYLETQKEEGMKREQLTSVKQPTFASWRCPRMWPLTSSGLVLFNQTPHRRHPNR